SDWVTIRIRRRSMRSVNTPPRGDTTMGKKLANVMNETQKAEWVSSSTYQERAMDCIHVPVFERNAPVHTSRKLRYRRESNDPIRTEGASSGPRRSPPPWMPRAPGETC